MNFQDFQKLRDTIRTAGFTPAQLILLYASITGRICDFEEFAAISKEASDLEEVMVEALDKYEEAQYVYQTDPADLVPVD